MKNISFVLGLFVLVACSSGRVLYEVGTGNTSKIGNGSTWTNGTATFGTTGSGTATYLNGGSTSIGTGTNGSTSSILNSLSYPPGFFDYDPFFDSFYGSYGNYYDPYGYYGPGYYPPPPPVWIDIPYGPGSSSVWNLVNLTQREIAVASNVIVTSLGLQNGKIVGSLEYCAQGDTLDITSQYRIGAKGHAWSTNIDLNVYLKGTNTLIKSFAQIMSVMGVNNDTSMITANSEKILTVTPGTHYRLEYKIYAGGAGTGQSTGDNSPIHIILKDYRTGY